MPSIRELRTRIRTERLEALAAGAQQAVAGRPGLEVWLFGSWARGDWDARSDVDMVAVAPTPEEADRLADDLLGACLADDVIPLTRERWRALGGADAPPHWRGIRRDALRLAPRGPAGRAP